MHWKSNYFTSVTLSSALSGGAPCEAGLAMSDNLRIVHKIPDPLVGQTIQTAVHPLEPAVMIAGQDTGGLLTGIEIS